jgi:hypothetical protein
MGPKAVPRHCPRCLAEYRADVGRCADCDVELVTGSSPAFDEPPAASDRSERLEPATPSIHPDDPPVVLCQVPQLEADLLVAKLRAEGLVAEADQRATIHLAMAGELGHARVWVLRSQLVSARRVLQRTRSGEDAI